MVFGGAKHRPVTQKYMNSKMKAVVGGPFLKKNKNITRRNIFKHVNFVSNSTQDPFEYLKKTRKFLKSISSLATNALNSGKAAKYDIYLRIAYIIGFAIASTFKNHSKVLKNSTDELMDLFAGLSVGSNLKESSDDLKELMDVENVENDPLEYIDTLEDYIEDLIDSYESMFEKNSVTNDKVNKMSIFASILAEDIEKAIKEAHNQTYAGIAVKKNNAKNISMNVNMNNTAKSPVSVNSSVNSYVNTRNNKINKNKMVVSNNINSLASLFNSTFTSAFGKK
jgi:hypothetical protein